MSAREVDCTFCHASGRVIADPEFACPHCDGRGYTLRADRDAEDVAETPREMEARLMALLEIEEEKAESNTRLPPGSRYELLHPKTRIAIAWILDYAQSWQTAALDASALLLRRDEQLAAADAVRECLSEQGELSREHCRCRVCGCEWIEEGQPGYAHELHSGVCPVAAYDRIRMVKP